MQRGASGRAGGSCSVQSPSLSPGGLFLGGRKEGKVIYPKSVLPNLWPGLLGARRSQKIPDSRWKRSTNFSWPSRGPNPIAKSKIQAGTGVSVPFLHPRDPPGTSWMQQKIPGRPQKSSRETPPCPKKPPPAPKGGASDSSQATALNFPLKTRYSTKRYDKRC